MSYRYAILLVAAPALQAIASTGVVQSYDSYGSWLVACDNGLHCVAKGLSDAYAGAQIVIDRDAGPGGKFSLSISADRAFALRDIAIDGKPAGLSGPQWAIDAADGSTTASSDDLPAIRRLVARLRNASKVTFGGDAEVSLDGFAAAVLRLDDRQGRAGGVTAIARPGPQPASRVPAPPPLPRIPHRPVTATLAAGEAARLIAFARADGKAMFVKEACDTDLAAMKPHAQALDRTQALVFIPCILGAYQGSSLGLVVPRAGGGHARRLVLPLPYRGNDPDRVEAAFFTNEDFDPKTGTLSTSAKGRGIGDCGLSASWIWDGKAFVLTAMTLQKTCGGVEAGDWPTLFRSRQE